MNYTHLSIQKTELSGYIPMSYDERQYAIQKQLKSEYERKMKTPTGFVRYKKDEKAH